MEARRLILSEVKNNQIELVTSFILDYENAKNRFLYKRQAISEFMSANESYYVSEDKNGEAIK